MTPSERLRALGLELPAVARPEGGYVPAVRVGQIVRTAGQIPTRGGVLTHTGRVPGDVSAEEAAEAASVAALNALAAAADLAGGIDAIRRIVGIRVYVNCEPDFTGHVGIANGASSLIAGVFGDDGRHARTTIGVGSLPLAATVEVEIEAEV